MCPPRRDDTILGGFVVGCCCLFAQPGVFTMVCAGLFWVSRDPGPFGVVPRPHKESLSGPGHTKMYAFFVEGDKISILRYLKDEEDTMHRCKLSSMDKLENTGKHE